MAIPNTQQKLNQSIFPDFPRGAPPIGQDGKFSPIWHLQLSALFQALQKNFSNEGFQIPQLTSQAASIHGDQFAVIAALYTPYIGHQLPQLLPNISGRMAYDYYASVPKMFIITFTTPGDPNSNITAASWKTFTLV